VSPARWLLAFAGVVIVGHHTGFLLEPLAARLRGGGHRRSPHWLLARATGQRWRHCRRTDALGRLDRPGSALPGFVGCAGAALAAAAAPRRVWPLFGFAAVLYTQGHGIHLAANSIANVTPAEPAHLWDELIGHYLCDEWAAEIANRTMHGVMHIGWVPDQASGYRGQMAVYAKPNGRLGTAYMAAIRPFRHLIVYPAMLRQIERQWRKSGSSG
jgi:hypothetical protein